MHTKLATAVEKSETDKMGTVHATYASQKSCPPSCPFLGSGCYAETGNVGFTTRRLNTAAAEATAQDVANAEAQAIRTLSGQLDLRIHVVGDCTTDNAASTVSTAALETIRRGREIWSYTHAWRDVDRASWGSVSVLASTESALAAEEALDRGWAAAVVLPTFAENKLYKLGNIKVMPCVQQTRGVQCVDCRLCMNSDRLRDKGMVIGFTPHGSGKKRVLQVVQS
jgi:hypothetical protein